jgi:hypothetical protein
MTRGPCTFRQQDLTRALKATVAAGIEVERIEIDATTGRIVIVTGKSECVANSNRNDWDEVLHGDH